MNAIKMGAVMLFHPLHAIDLMKRNSRYYGRIPALVLLLCTLVARIITVICQNYTVSGTELVDANFLLDILIILVPFATWILANYFMTEIMSGETNLSDIMAYTSYSLLPYILTAPLFIAASWAMSDGLMPFYNLAQLLVFTWVAALLVLGVMRANDYAFWQTMLVVLILLISMLLVWALLILFFSLISQTYMVIAELLYEIKLGGATS